MITSANFATWSARKNSINRAIDSVIDQVDITRVFYNDYTPQKRTDIIQYHSKGDLTDRGKFYGIGKNEIAFTCDDDLFYPPDYVEKTLEAMGNYPVVSYHGRNLQGKGLDYYRDHITYHFMMPQPKDVEVDVFGTGVAAINTNKFNPNILYYKEDKMVDLLASIEAAKKKVPIICLAHKAKWIGILTSENSIYQDQNKNCDIQNKLSDRIIDIKYGSNAFD